jgi:tRNA dimethylallyltransferase
LTSEKKKLLVVIAGPTASGKTQLGIELAKTFKSEIVSADSRQFYREISIGTAKPSESELKAVPHHFINSHDLEDPVSAGRYEKEALSKLEKLFQTQDVVFLVGGSGLFIDALCRGFDDLPEHDDELRSKLEERLQNDGLESLLDELKVKDPEYYENVDRNNPHRIIRALEVIELSGQSFSRLRSGGSTARPFNILKFCLNPDRDLLYQRINHRVDLMLDLGLEEEVRSVQHLQHLKSLQTVGYSEFFTFFEGDIDRTEAVRLIKRNTRRYAKRQMTWFRRDPDYIRIQLGDTDKIIRHIRAAL